MKKLKITSVLFATAFAMVTPIAVTGNISASAAPSSTKIVTTATGYDSADDVDYVQSGKYIANWGARGENCVFLSTYAEDFYSGSEEYSTLSQKAGGSSQSNAPSSALYAALQDVMTEAHTFYTYYDGSKNVRDFYEYTDCVQSNTSKVSILYRGDIVTSTWNGGSTWNQEHVWPKSKLSTSQQIGDIMHLRPSNPSENSSRGNKAYGTTTSGSYYNPGVSVRGDCARMVLYMYVRWGATGTMWGSGGVMENLSVLLDWMEEDPVDTWEMGRNDAVQSITGTRNVFVDYPEYAWLLFGEKIPSDLSTPSGIAKNQGSGNVTPDNPGSSDQDPTPDNPGSSDQDPTPDNPGASDQDPAPDNGCAHEYGDWIVTSEPTDDDAGERIRACGKCGKLEKETLPALSEAQLGCPSNGGGAHKYGDWIITSEPTAESEGERIRACENCGNLDKQTLPKADAEGCNATVGGAFGGITLLTVAGAVLLIKRNAERK